MKMVPHRIITEFYADWLAHMRQELKKAGYDIAPADNNNIIERKFFNALRRRIQQKPRKVIAAPDLQVPSSLASGYASLYSKIAAGADLTPHQSRRIFRSLNFDILLYDWDIHHLHLGTTFLPNGMIDGTDDVLFAKITKDEAYLIRILPHGSWADFQLIEVIHRYWPHLLDEWELAGILPPEEPLTNDEWKKVRAVHMNAPIVIGGKTYASPGGGITSAGDCARAIMEIDRARFELKAQEDSVRQNPEVLFSVARKKGLALPPIVRGWFRIYSGRAFLEEPRSKIRVPLDDFTK